jgi:hypothetical protein
MKWLKVFWIPCIQTGGSANSMFEKMKGKAWGLTSFLSKKKTKNLTEVYRKNGTISSYAREETWAILTGP